MSFLESYLEVFITRLNGEYFLLLVNGYFNFLDTPLIQIIIQNYLLEGTDYSAFLYYTFGYFFL